MNLIFARVVFSILVLLAPAVLQAQTEQIGYGTFSVNFNQNFLGELTTLGFTVNKLSGEPLNDGTAVFTANLGNLDLKTSIGEVISSGGYLIKSPVGTIKLLNLQYEEIDYKTANVTAFLVLNDLSMGRVKLFNVLVPQFPLPIVLNNGVINGGPLGITLTPAFVKVIDQLMGHRTLTPDTQIGACSIFSFFKTAVSKTDPASGGSGY